uniref:Uncharacterized protein n=1 Tax=Rhizophora mucronata TaxID=61149 RepID=A0A2P2R4E3_RHIMU
MGLFSKHCSRRLSCSVHPIQLALR